MAAGTGLRDGGAFPILSLGSRARADLEHPRRRRRRKLKTPGQHCTALPLCPGSPPQSGWAHPRSLNPVNVGFAGRGKTGLGAAPTIGATPMDKGGFVPWGGRTPQEQPRELFSCFPGLFGALSQTRPCRAPLSSSTEPVPGQRRRCCCSCAGSGAQLLSPGPRQSPVQGGTALLERAGPIEFGQLNGIVLILLVRNPDFSLVGALPGAEAWGTPILPCPTG